jgi:uncharacterized protein (DUF362 family)
MENEMSNVGESTLGKGSVDSHGAPIGVVRMDPEKSYAQIPLLLQKYINESDKGAWGKIKEKIDYTFHCLNSALRPLEEATGFGKMVKAQVKEGKKILFKPNLVAPVCIDPFTHGEGPGSPACTQWPFIAALLRWFHDQLEVSYYSMAVGEAGTSISNVSRLFGLVFNDGRPIPTEAVLEGRYKDFYGGWGFYFARKYLADAHPKDHTDDPMHGYEESISEKYLPPGQASSQMMIYDLNRIFDVPSKWKDVIVPDGANFKEITLHKVIVGGDPGDANDYRDYPGCVLVNVPRLKIHTQALLTNAIKNLGIGLYPMEAASRENPKSTRWKYSFPFKPTPTLKSEIPHSVWFAEVDDETGLPLRDENGKYKAKRTAGLSGTMVDIVKAVQSQGVFWIHVVDAIEAINIRHDGFPESVKIPEGFAFASLDPVALDLLGARYLFKTTPIAEARRLQRERNLATRFLQRVPFPEVEGKNIVTREGFDSPLRRNDLFRYAEERGLGQQKYYVLGYDQVTQSPLASVEGHLGRLRERQFSELMTSNLYYCSSKILWDLQTTILNYARANDQLTGSSYHELFMKTFDEDGDGIISYDEMGRNGFWHPFMRVMANTWHDRGKEPYGSLKSSFRTLSQALKFSSTHWNAEGHDFSKELVLVRACALAFRMSQAQEEARDPFFPTLAWGKGKWPSIQLAHYALAAVALYGQEFPHRVNLLSLYGFAFQYADKKFNGGKYTGGPGLANNPDTIQNYLGDEARSLALLDFVIFVPKGYGNLNVLRLPNIQETEEPVKIFTASFDQGRVVW